MIWLAYRPYPHQLEVDTVNSCINLFFPNSLGTVISGYISSMVGGGTCILEGLLDFDLHISAGQGLLLVVC